MKSKRSKACEIPTSVKEKVYERDGRRCILCGSPYGMPNAHFIPRSKGGLGVEENIVTLCLGCHTKLDNSKYRGTLLERVRRHLESIYGEVDIDELRYKKK